MKCASADASRYNIIGFVPTSQPTDTCTVKACLEQKYLRFFTCSWPYMYQSTGLLEQAPSCFNFEVSEWPSDKNYQYGLQIIQHLEVVNDVAERGIQLIK